MIPMGIVKALVRDYIEVSDLEAQLFADGNEDHYRAYRDGYRFSARQSLREWIKANDAL